MFGGFPGGGPGTNVMLPRGRALGDLGIDDRSRAPRAAAALHHGDRGDAHHADGRPVRARAWSSTSSPTSTSRSSTSPGAINGPQRRGHGAARRAGHRARLFHHRQRHRAHRIAVDPGHRHPQDLFPAGHRHRRRHRADLRAEQRDPAHRAAGHARRRTSSSSTPRTCRSCRSRSTARRCPSSRSSTTATTSCACGCSRFPGLSIPAPFGGKQRQIIVEVDPGEG